MMDTFKEDIEIGASVGSFLGLLNLQKELFHSQVDQLQRVVVTQCQLTGVNPLAQEMAAGALSIKIEKKPRDLLNPKAIKYMQAVFSIKDAIGKKETREISALFGITVRQVRDFFVSQKSRVRKQVRLSREKAISFTASNDQTDGVLKDQNAIISACTERPDDVLKYQNAIMPLDPVPLDSAPAASTFEVALDPVPLNSIGPTTLGEAGSTSSKDDVPLDITDSDRHFAENIFHMMRKEETFSGQVKLIEWILQIQDSSVLIWFLTKGGVMVLTTWLNQAATEEQTSVILVILKVLCHLPLHKASPETMSAVLQGVSGLRFYRTSDVSNRARVLLSRWTKLFAKIQAMKKPNGMKSYADAHSQMLLKQSIIEIMGGDGNPEEFLSPSSEGLESIRRLEYAQAPKLLLTAGDDSAKKQILGPSSSYNRERRKVQLVEQPGEKASGRNAHNSRTVAVNQSRPLSADDIQKAKMRALYMQSKYGKKDSSSNAFTVAKSGGLDKPPTVQPAKDSPSSVSSEMKTTGQVVEPSGVQPNIVLPLSNISLRLNTEEQNRLPAVPSKTYKKLGISHDTKQKMNPQVIFAKCKKIQIAWLMPPEIKINELWRIGTGESSKEVDVQRNRNRREKETTYRSSQEIPLNPKEPWDREMDYDDTLTPEIPTEQPPDTEATEPNSTEQQGSLTESLSAAIASASSTSIVKSGGTQEPDLELLAVLLKNPELVYALTSGKAGSSTNQATVKLLDMIKTGGAGLAGGSNGAPVRVEEKVEVSLPSPTPSSNPGTIGWRPEAAKNPFSKQLVPQAAAASRQYQQPTTMAPFMHHQAQPSLPPTRIEPQLLQTSHHHLQQPVLSNLSNSSVHTPVYYNREPTQNIGATTSDVWRTQQRNNASYYSHQPDPNIRSNAPSFQPRAYPQFTGNPGFESWSPDNSPSRNTGVRPAYGADWTRQQNSQGYWDRNGRWHDHKR